MLYFFLINVSIQLSCTPSLTLYGSTFERIEIDLRNLVSSENADFSLNDESFNIKQTLHILNSTKFELNYLLIDMHTLKQGVYSTDIRGLLIKNHSFYQVFYPNLQTVYYTTLRQCQFVRIIRENVVLLGCNNKILIANTNAQITVDSQIQDITITDVLIYVITQTQVNIFFYDYTLKDTNSVIDSNMLNQLMQTTNLTYNITSVEQVRDELILLDKFKGLIILQIDDNFKFLLKSNQIYTIRWLQYEYLSVINEGANYLIACYMNSSQILIVNNTISFTVPVNLPKLQNIQLIGQINKDVYLCVESSTFLQIMQIQPIQNIKQLTFKDKTLINYDAIDSILYVVQSTQQTNYQVSRGLLILNPQQEMKSLQQSLMIATEDSQCAVQINYMFYKYLDNKLYIKNNVEYQIQKLINYPTQLPIFNEIGVTGSNIKAQIQLNDDSIQLKLGYLEKLKINIITENAIFVDLYQVEQQIYYLVQYSKSKAILYLCYVIQQYEFNCQKVHDFNPNRQLDRNSFQWIYNGIITFGYISKFQHTIELFQLKQSIVTQNITIFTSIQDINSTITGFYLTKNYIYVIQSLKSKIEIYSLTGALINFITQYDLLQFNFTPISVQMQQNLLLITCDKLIILGYFVDQFKLLDYLYFEQSEFIQISCTLNTIFIALDYGFKQEILEYSTRYSQFTFLKSIPLFHYILQEPYYIMSQMNLIIIRAYTPVLQETVLLIYQPEVELRQSLLTTISLGYIEGPLNVGITSYNYIGLILHIDSDLGQQDLFVSKDFQAQITSKWDDQYIHFKQLNIKYHSIDSPYKTEFVQNVTFLNLMTNIEAIQDQQVLQITNQVVQIPNNWFNGLIVEYSMECTSCNDLIQLTQKINQISNIQHYENILSQCQLEKDLFVVLTEKSLLFFDSQHLIKNQSFYFQLEYQPQKVWCKDNIILITGEAQRIITNYFMVVILRENNSTFRQIETVYYLRVKQKIAQIEIINNNNLLILDAQYEWRNENTGAQLCAWFIQYYPPNQIIIQLSDCIGYPDQVEFYVTSFIIYQTGSLYRVFMNEQNNGIYVQDFELNQKNQLLLKNSILIISPRQQLDFLLGSCQNIIYSKIIQSNTSNNFQTFDIILLTKQIAHLQIRITFDDDIYQNLTITQFLQRYSDFNLVYESSLVDGYLALAYQDSKSYTICIYKLDNNKNQSINKWFGGIQIEESKNQFFSLILDSNGQLLLQLQQNNKNMTLYKVEESATITFLNDAQFSSITLTAKNLISTSSINVQINKIIESKQYIYWIIFILLIIALGILFLMFLGAYLQRKKNKTQFKKKPLF